MANALPPPTGDAKNPPNEPVGWGKLFNWFYLLWKSVTHLTFGADPSTYSAAVFATIGQADTGGVSLLPGTTVIVSAHSTNGPTMTNNVTTIVTGFTTALDTSNGAWNASTGTFTCNSPGNYFFSAKFRLNNADTAAKFESTTILRKNGADASNAETYVYSNNASAPVPTALGIFTLVQGDTLQVGVFQSSGANQTLATSSQFSQFTIFKLP